MAKNETEFALKIKDTIMYPYKAYSWTILTASIAVKEMDKSAFIHHGTGIPKEVLPFFGLENNKEKSKVQVALIYNDKSYSGYFSCDATHTRIRLFWKSDFEKEIQHLFPSFYNLAESKGILPLNVPKIRFQKIANDGSNYNISFILPEEIMLDIKAEEECEFSPNKEGAKKEYWTTKYERDLNNRQRALELHGNSCIACGFNFGKTYGTRGEGFIEVHHTIPLASLNEEVTIKPESDLVPLCSNCHRMIHRRKDHILTIDELKQMIKI